jgi:hypothetical protein
MEPVVYTPVSAVANLRRSTIIGVVLSVFGIAATASLGHLWMGFFGLLGIVLGAVNNFMLQKSVLRFAANEQVTRKRFGGGVAMRLGAVTLFAIGVGLLDNPDGLGVFVGLAVFQILMLVGAAVPVFRSLRPTT